MTSTYTDSHATTFTASDAKYIASKVETDLMRLHRYYYESHGHPTKGEIHDYYMELVLLQKFDFLDEIEYGFLAEKRWIKALKYAARQGGVLTGNHAPGGISCTRIPGNATFTSFLQYNNRWHLDPFGKQQFLLQTPVVRESGSGYLGNWSQNRSYSSGGQGLVRWDI